MENFESTELNPEVVLMERYDQVQLELIDDPENPQLLQESADLEQKLNIEKTA